jgi:ubiquinone/menaquinone biosynthesis C-methylase UbiE
MSDAAAIYEEWFVPAVFAPLAREVLDHTDIPAGARVLDIACGTGIVARTVARQMGPTGRVVGLDLSPAMLAIAQRAARAEELEIEWREGSAEDLPFDTGAFDLVVCQMGLMFFPDRPRAVSEMHRVLAPGRRMVVSTWRGLDQNPFFAVLARAVRRQIGSSAVETPHSLGDPAALAILLQEAGFSNISVEPVLVEANYAQPENYIALQFTAMAAAIPELQRFDPTELTALIAAIGQEMAAPVQLATIGDRLRVPIQGLVARATA